ncbi:MAG: hypothetical protein U1E33_08790 [Rhodospirillales bacterium]
MVGELKSRRILPVVLSGDAERVALAVGRELAIDDVHGGVRPEDKATAVQTLRQRGRGGGDGRPTTSAMRSAATDRHRRRQRHRRGDPGDSRVTLMRADPKLVPAALDISRATWAKIRQNLFWAIHLQCHRRAAGGAQGC